MSSWQFHEDEECENDEHVFLPSDKSRRHSVITLLANTEYPIDEVFREMHDPTFEHLECAKCGTYRIRRADDE